MPTSTTKTQQQHPPHTSHPNLPIRIHTHTPPSPHAFELSARTHQWSTQAPESSASRSCSTASAATASAGCPRAPGTHAPNRHPLSVRTTTLSPQPAPTARPLGSSVTEVATTASAGSSGASSRAAHAAMRSDAARGTPPAQNADTSTAVTRPRCVRSKPPIAAPRGSGATRTSTSPPPRGKKPRRTSVAVTPRRPTWRSSVGSSTPAARRLLNDMTKREEGRGLLSAAPRIGRSSA
eukprot:354859-Chlamydomonas_euryale.AAC.6